VRSLRAAARIPAGRAPADNLLEQRIYHVTHVSNLPAIVTAGAIITGATPTLDLSPAEVRAKRGEIAVPGSSSRTLSGYVPFFLSPDAQLWQTLRAGKEHPRLAPSAIAADPFDFVFLVSSVRHVVNASTAFVVADRNSEGGTTRFATTREDAERMLHRLRGAENGEQLLEAELLVAERLPLESVTLIGVANDRVRQSVRNVLGGSDFTPKISVYPPWFQQPE
jgi:hypothetical protein